MNKDHEVIHVGEDGNAERISRDHDGHRSLERQRQLQDAESKLPEGIVRVRRDTDLGNDKRPSSTSGWTRKRKNERRSSLRASSFTYWTRREVSAISALEMATAPDGKGDTIPQWHLSLSVAHGNRRPTDEECKQALACFGLAGAEEDNHHPGVARHFWMPVDASRRVDCECKTTERVVVEPDGYKYSEKIGTCAGCDLELEFREKGVVRTCEKHGRPLRTGKEIAAVLGEGR